MVEKKQLNVRIPIEPLNCILIARNIMKKWWQFWRWKIYYLF